MPGYHAGRPPRNKGQLYPADPPSVEEIVAVMRAAGDDRHEARLRALIAVYGAAGCGSGRRSSSQSATSTRGAGRCACGGNPAADARSGWTRGGSEQLRPWLAFRLELPVGQLFCVIDGPTRGHAWSAAGVRVEFRRLAAEAGVRRRFAPHQLCHAHALELARAGVPRAPRVA